MSYEWRGEPLGGVVYGEDSLHVPNGMQTLFPCRSERRGLSYCEKAVSTENKAEEPLLD